MLWIKTQDKQSVICAKEVTVTGKKLIGVIGSATLGDWSKDLGKYDSKERAVEILDEIFMKIEGGSSISVTHTMPEK